MRSAVVWSHGSARAVGDYEGRERTLDVFDAQARDQRDLLTRFRAMRPEIERAGAPSSCCFTRPTRPRACIPTPRGVSATTSHLELLLELIEKLWSRSQ